ncbi:NAD-dependent protein deacylase [Brevibacillus dissolubilis]|uniref:NAD-dependent protein deacylase n=1 Tax=Brevibacillus dissolubilis TaxID=1844116 RepID=UPI0011178E02|nr:NAD-dependent protein deacylase [Brevibacillus dissolubilis]
MNQLAAYLKQANHTVVFTGAGMSTESGIPDFRSAKGIWKEKDPMQLASTYALMRNRDEFFAFYQKRIKGLISCQPHRGHKLLAEWERDGLIHSIITQNVDGFHQRAGSQHVIELHGTIARLHCIDCGQAYDLTKYIEENGSVCTCGGFIRPNVVLFGESLPHDAVDQAELESSQADLFIVLGSSLQVSPANYFPIEAKRNGAKLVIVNMEPTDYDEYADLVIHDRKIGEVLAEVNQLLI